MVGLIDPFYRELKYRTLFQTLKQKAIDEREYHNVLLLREEQKRIESKENFLDRLKEYRKFIANYNDYNGYWFA